MDDRVTIPQHPHFLITIDTEGDNLWAQPRIITTRNADYLPRFQALCERYGLRPTYLTNYEMAQSPAFIEFGRDVLARNTAEIGMHLHAWNNPPFEALTADDYRFQPYLCQYPTSVMRAKIHVVTELLEQTFGVKMLSHRAGRWGFDAAYAQILIEHGYRVDCSVTPHVTWQHTPGDPQQYGGPDFRTFPDHAYFLDPADIQRAGRSSLLEVPMTILAKATPWPVEFVKRLSSDNSLLKRACNHWWPDTCWLQPTRRNNRCVLRIMTHIVSRQRPYAQLTLHSSELMPGGSPTFRTARDIEGLYATLEELCAYAHAHFRPTTLMEYHQHVLAQGDATTSPAVDVSDMKGQRC